MTLNVRREFAFYGVASVCAFGADIALLSMLVRTAGMHYLAAATVSFTVGALVSYLLCIRFVFSFRRITRVAPEFGVFLGIGVVGLGLNAVAMAIGVEMLGLHFLLAKVGAAGVTFLANFTLRKILLFRPSAQISTAGTQTGQGKI